VTAGYVKNIDFYKEAREILKPNKALELDLDKFQAEEALDEYYVFITSEYGGTSERIIEMHRGLWKTEESFRVTKSDLKVRPIFVSREDYIEIHFPTYFAAQVITRIQEMKIDHKYGITKTLERLNATYTTKLLLL